MTESNLYGNKKQESPPTPSLTQQNLSFFSPLFLASNTIALHPQREREFPIHIHSLKGLLTEGFLVCTILELFD
ncbi:hypothetical protein NC651_000810 [Populus alba x Populus x berolinensis]|nr:hypothetical protein NC651_000810 [Populus alba x Populus x berolinensis]